MVLAEALDRISRDQADIATLYKQLRFAGVTVVTLAEGEISELHVGLKGTMNALFLKDLALKTHRGLKCRVEKGKAGGGLCYGYCVIRTFDGNGEPVRGEQEIIPAEAKIIRRIFREFASGKSPKAIAIDLNKEGIAGPLGRKWGDTSVRGHASRGTGIINNELYTGVLVWNRQRYVKDPMTGRRVARPNPASEWIRTEVPHLKIIDMDLWNAVKTRQQQITSVFGSAIEGGRQARAKKLHMTNRPASFLTGMLVCGCCGGKYGFLMRDRYGCLNHHRRGTCENNRTVTRQNLEGRILEGLKRPLVSAEAVEEAVRAYAQEVNEKNCERRARQQAERQELAKVEKAIGTIISAIEQGMFHPSMKARMDDLEAKKADLLSRQSETVENIPDMHPNIASVYRKRVETLSETLHDCSDDGRQAIEALRSLFKEIVLTPGAKRGEVFAELRGELIGILDFTNPELTPGKFDAAAVAANPRNQHKLHLSCIIQRPVISRLFPFKIMLLLLIKPLRIFFTNLPNNCSW